MTIGDDDLYNPQDVEQPPKGTGDAPWLAEVPEEEGSFFTGKSRNIAVAFGGVLALTVFASLVWYLYGRANDMAINANVPIIKASKDPIKVEPEDRGGMKVPDQDKLVFDRVNGKARGEAEKVQPEAEQPKDVPNKGGGDPATAGAKENDEPTAAKPKATKPKASVIKPAGLRESDIPANSFMIQMGAFGSTLRATTAWDGFLAKHPRPLAKLAYHIQPVTLSSGSQLYRLRAGPFTTRPPADEACRILKARNQACLVVPAK